jgi:hypothetical protein
MPIVILVSAATAGIIYISLGQVLEASARDIAASEAASCAPTSTIHTIADLASTHEINVGNRVSQIVDDHGTVSVTTDRTVATPMLDPTIPVGELTVTTVDALPGWREGVRACRRRRRRLDGRRYTVLVAVATQDRDHGPGPVDGVRADRRRRAGRAAGAVTTFAIGQALRPSSGCVTRSRASPAHAGPVIEVPPGRDELAKLAETSTGARTARRADAARRAFVGDAGTSCAARSPPSACCSTGCRRTARSGAALVAARPRRRSTGCRCSSTTCSSSRRPTSARCRSDRVEVDLDDVVLAEAGAAARPRHAGSRCASSRRG